MNIRMLSAWGATILVPVAVYFAAPENISPQFPMFLACTVTAIMAWATSILPATVVAALLAFGYTLTGVADPATVFSPWSTVLPWLTFAAVNIGLAMERTNLARRLALHCLRITGGTFHGLVVGFALAGLALVIILPSVLARMVICCAIAVGIIDALKLGARSRMSSAIVMLAFFAASAPLFMFLHSSEAFIWAFDMLFKGTDVSVDFWEYLRQGTLINLIYYVMSISLVYVVKGRDKLTLGAELRRFIDASFVELGPMSRKEVKLLVIVIAVILGFMTQTVTGLNPVYVFCVLALACYFPGIDILRDEDMRRLNISIMVFVTGCMAIGFVGGKVGANAWAVEQLMPWLQHMGDTSATLASYVFGVVVNFLLTPLAAMAAFTPAFADLGHALHVNPLPMFYAFNFGLDQYIFPYEAVYYLYIFVTGKVMLRYIAGALALRMLLAGIFVAIIAIPYWKLIGLMQ